MSLSSPCLLVQSPDCRHVSTCQTDWSEDAPAASARAIPTAAELQARRDACDARFLAALTPEQQLEWEQLQQEGKRLEQESKLIEERMRKLVWEREQDRKRRVERSATLPPDQLGLVPSGGKEKANFSPVLLCLG